MKKGINEAKAKKVFGENFIKLARPLIKIFGLKAAVMLCDLYSEYEYWSKKGKVNQYDYFYSTIENITENTGLSAYEQREAIELLEEYGVIKVHLFGMPATRHIKIVEEGLDKLIKEIGDIELPDINEVDEGQVAAEKKPEPYRKSNGKRDPSRIATSLKDVDLIHTF